jgi:hypothetical protein
MLGLGVRQHDTALAIDDHKVFGAEFRMERKIRRVRSQPLLAPLAAA